MPKEKIELMVDGGKAVAGPIMGQKLGPLRININEVLQKINEKTVAFKGMKVPVKVIVDTKDKSYEVEVGTPPTTELIKKEAKLEKGAGTPDKSKIANLSIEQVIKIAKMKQDSMFVNSLKSAVKCVIGSCNSLGILVEGMTAPEVNLKLQQGKFDTEILEEKIETDNEKFEILNIQLKEVQERLKKELEKLAAEEEIEKKKVEVPVKEAEKVEEKEEEGKKEVKKEVKEEVKKPGTEKKVEEKVKK